MKYLVRSVKYFFYFVILMTAIILVLVLIGAVEGNINEIFEDGWNSLWKIAVFFVLIAAVYPKFAFISRRLSVQAGWEQVQAEAIAYFRERGLDLETESADTLTFRRRSAAARIGKMNEDRITLTRTDEGYLLEGLRKDIILFATALEYKISPNQE